MRKLLQCIPKIKSPALHSNRLPYKFNKRMTNKQADNITIIKYSASAYDIHSLKQFIYLFNFIHLHSILTDLMPKALSSLSKWCRD